MLQLLIRPERGELLLDGAPMQRDPIATRRRMAAAFQEPLLLSMSVRANVELGLRLRRLPRAQRRTRARHWLDRFGVGHLADRHAHDVSGGEAQRVSLARGFALDPEVLLLDEPFAALDAPTRSDLIEDFASVLAESRPTTVLVTHDRDEARRLGDGIVVLIDGRLRQRGSPAEVFRRSCRRGSRRFRGESRTSGPRAWNAPAPASRRIASLASWWMWRARLRLRLPWSACAPRRLRCSLPQRPSPAVPATACRRISTRSILWAPCCESSSIWATARTRPPSRRSHRPQSKHWVCGWEVRFLRSSRRRLLTSSRGETVRRAGRPP